MKHQRLACSCCLDCWAVPCTDGACPCPSFIAEARWESPVVTLQFVATLKAKRPPSEWPFERFSADSGFASSSRLWRRSSRVRSSRESACFCVGRIVGRCLLGPTFLNFWGCLSLPWCFGKRRFCRVCLKFWPRWRRAPDVHAGLETDVKMMRSAVAPAFWAATAESFFLCWRFAALSEIRV